MDLYYIQNFFDKLNSEKTIEHLRDTWKITFNYPDRKKEYLMLVYFGIGCDGSVVKTLHTVRNYFPFLFQINKITKLFYAISHIKHWIVQILRGADSVKLKKMSFNLDGK